MEITWLWWLPLVAAVPMLAAPAFMAIRRCRHSRVRFFGPPSVRVPWWAHVLGIAGIALGLLAAEGLGGREDDHLYAGGALIASFVLVTGLILVHNRRVAAEASGAREGVPTEPSAGG